MSPSTQVRHSGSVGRSQNSRYVSNRLPSCVHIDSPMLGWAT
jgi:hypothetical protein